MKLKKNPTDGKLLDLVFPCCYSVFERRLPYLDIYVEVRRLLFCGNTWKTNVSTKQEGKFLCILKDNVYSSQGKNTVNSSSTPTDIFLFIFKEAATIGGSNKAPEHCRKLRRLWLGNGSVGDLIVCPCCN